MLRGVPRPVLLTLAIVLALLPLVELVDHWESYGSDPEFVSVCTVLGVAFGIALAFRRTLLSCLRRLVSKRFSLSRSGGPTSISPDVIQAVFVRIRAPIRI